MNPVTDGSVNCPPTSGASQKSAMKIAWLSVTPDATSRIAAAAKYSGIAAARPSTITSTKKRADSRWSPNSLAATTVQPEPGTDRVRGDGTAVIDHPPWTPYRMGG